MPDKVVYLPQGSLGSDSSGFTIPREPVQVNFVHADILSGTQNINGATRQQIIRDTGVAVPVGGPAAPRF